MKNYLITAVIAAVVAVAVAYLAAPAQPVQPEPLGAAGSTFSNQVNFQDNIVVGGYDFATSSQGAATYTAAAFARSRVIEHIAAAVVTVTTPTNAALSAIGYLPNVGDTASLFIHASTSAVTLVGGTGVTVGAASSSIRVAANQTGKIDCVRLGATEARAIQCILTSD
jgi:hypothetical protein